MRTGLRFGWTVAVANRGSSTTNPNQHRMHRTRLHLTIAHNRLRSTAGFATAAAFRALVHVQLTRLHGTTTASSCTATPGALYASPHPLHSTTGVRLTNARPTPLDALDSPRQSSTNFGPLRHPQLFDTRHATLNRRAESSRCANCKALPLRYMYLNTFVNHVEGCGALSTYVYTYFLRDSYYPIDAYTH